jgi:putative SOS response-associated peptidase YedK
LDDIVKAFDVQHVAAQAQSQLRPSYNVAPTQTVAVVLRPDGGNVLEEMVWGLIPFWAKERAIGSRMINARAETLAEKPSFKRPLATQRCLVVADGFYEWRKTEEGKVPMYIRMKSGQPFGFAGLYDTWTSPEGETVRSCTIVTTDANALVRPIHDRMPVILPKLAEAAWLDFAARPVGDLLALLRPYPAAELEAYAVSRLVNSPDHNAPELILPVAA